MGQRPPKVIVYTAIFGDYDSVTELTVKDPNADYILFTDNPNLKSKTWLVVRTSRKMLDARLMSRLLKWSPETYLYEHDYSVWVDARFSTMVSDWQPIVSHVKTVMCFKHDVRDCIYDEAQVCKDMKLDDYKAIDTQIGALKLKEYPKNNGLQSTGFLIRKINDFTLLLNKFMAAHLLTTTIRDQLIFNYACWRLGIKIQQPPHGVNIYENPYLSKAKKHLKPRSYDL